MTSAVEDRLELHRSANDAWGHAVRVLAVLVLLAAALTGWIAARGGPEDIRPTVAEGSTYRTGTIDGQTSPAVVAAVAVVQKALSYDYRTLDEGLDQAVVAMSPEFAEEFRATFDQVVRDMAVSTKAATTAEVRGAGIIDTDDSAATVLVYVDQSLADGQEKQRDPSAQVSQSRVVVELKRIDGDWLVSAITPI